MHLLALFDPAVAKIISHRQDIHFLPQQGVKTI
jgi:hypothetical protein